MTREDMLLVKLMEECGEVIQACSKALRFGLTDIHPRGYEHNSVCISREFLDACTVVDILKEEGSIPNYRTCPEARKGKVEKYMKVSQELGRLGNG